MERSEKYDPPKPPPGTVSEGGVDERTGAMTGGIAGALLGAAGGPVGFIAGAAVGALVGQAAAAGPEHPWYPEHWQEERQRLHKHGPEQP